MGQGLRDQGLDRQSGEAFRDDLGHAQVGVVFNALGGADDDLAGVKMGAEAGEGGAEKLRRDDGDDDLGIGDGGVVAGDGDLGGEGKAGEEERVFAGVDDLLRGLRAVRPEGELVAAAAVERECDGGSPGAGTEDDDAAHAVFLWLRSGIPCRRAGGGCSGGAWR